ncbi:antibiotic biosynthesis monooxygenase [Acinetobacter halotolerans]|uniref:Antibiotic biosynthesis monooxygenase n=1 Tax=Acinetobacter halotolerans TaxID=1752076 RepID=A0A4Q6X9U4_9GAMM|nr:putative quinol monooxygenase [Acinetobacter halotolerans]RZF51698.1 antibiotic biosynthesis monooxygenase [Acinetobacter halotolerans]
MTLKLIAEDFIQPDKIKIVLPLYQELVEKTKAEAGCLAYDLYHDIKQKGHFVFIEEWVDRAALDQHIQSEHFQRLVAKIDQYQVHAGRFTHLHGFEKLLQE